MPRKFRTRSLPPSPPSPTQAAGPSASARPPCPCPGLHGPRLRGQCPPPSPTRQTRHLGPARPALPVLPALLVRKVRKALPAQRVRPRRPRRRRTRRHPTREGCPPPPSAGAQPQAGQGCAAPTARRRPPRRARPRPRPRPPPPPARPRTWRRRRQGARCALRSGRRPPTPPPTCFRTCAPPPALAGPSFLPGSARSCRPWKRAACCARAAAGRSASESRSHSGYTLPSRRVRRTSFRPTPPSTLRKSPCRAAAARRDRTSSQPSGRSRSPWVAATETVCAVPA
mmetsp:Transcript_29602/g.69265  ORF Transcript_29602/g.69265 Transcript_29602/m.69265 type:complete len:284 (+) Transcript_29602:674-1525(+)